MRRRLAYLVLCAVAIVGASEAQRLLHFLLEPHAVCEHGLPMHADSHAVRAPGALAGGGVSARGTVSSRQDRGPHEHCNGQAVPLATPNLGVRVPALVVWPWLSSPLQWVGGTLHGPIELLALAPKLPPPLG